MSVESSTDDSTDLETSAEEAMEWAVKGLPERFDCHIYERNAEVKFLIAEVEMGFKGGDLICGSSQTRCIERQGFDYERCYLEADGAVQLWFKYNGTEE